MASMQKDNNISVLCTRPLSESLCSEVALSGINIDCLQFIETEAIDGIEVQQEIEQVLLQTATIVFTSMNAVEAVVTYLEGQEPAWRIYCIGASTRRLVAEHFGDYCIAGTAPDASQLAAEIIEDGETEEVIFFCGDQRRDELPDLLQRAGIDVQEIMVYHTVEVPHLLQKIYPAVLFFSPSAVRSFFRNNRLAPGAVAFAIGKTTAAEIAKHSKNEIVISETPEKEQMMKQVVEWFS